MILVVAALAGAEVGEVVDELDGGDPLDHLEAEFAFAAAGMKGVYQRCGEQHLHRYLSEFDFRYTNRIATGVDDTGRAQKAVEGAIGRRLTYRQPHWV